MIKIYSQTLYFSQLNYNYIHWTIRNSKAVCHVGKPISWTLNEHSQKSHSNNDHLHVLIIYSSFTSTCSCKDQQIELQLKRHFWAAFLVTYQPKYMLIQIQYISERLNSANNIGLADICYALDKKLFLAPYGSFSFLHYIVLSAPSLKSVYMSVPYSMLLLFVWGIVAFPNICFGLPLCSTSLISHHKERTVWWNGPGIKRWKKRWMDRAKRYKAQLKEGRTSWARWQLWW